MCGFTSAATQQNTAKLCQQKYVKKADHSAQQWSLDHSANYGHRSFSEVIVTVPSANLWSHF